MNERPRVFISYSHSDAKQTEWVRNLAKELHEHELSVWFDERQVRLGEKCSRESAKALRHSTVVIPVLSRGYEASPKLFFELGVAMAGGKQLIPVVTKDVNRTRLPSAIRSRRFLTMGSPDKAARQIVEALQPAVGESEEPALIAAEA